jgi:hypothetical protein
MAVTFTAVASLEVAAGSWLAGANQFERIGALIIFAIWDYSFFDLHLQSAFRGRSCRRV